MDLEDSVVDASAPTCTVNTSNREDDEEPPVNSSTLASSNNISNTHSDDERPSCKFGTHCYRQNPRHRVDMAHPGDADYEVPDMPPHNKGAPKCEYGRKCYRLNPEHFKDFEHPSNINVQENYRKKYLRTTNNDSGSDDGGATDDDDEEEDPFSGDADDSDYVPSGDD